MLRSWVLGLAVSAVSLVNGCGTASGQERRTVLAVSGEDVSRALSLHATENGSYAIGSNELTLRLDFKAELAGDAAQYRIVGSRAFLKAEGPDRSHATPAIAAGSRAMAASGEITFAVDPLGPVAQNAKAACAAGKPPAPRTREVSMLLPVVWRVTTGEFAFARLAAAGLQPDEAMLSDATYYGATADEDAEASVSIKITCKETEVAALASTQPEKSKPARMSQPAPMPPSPATVKGAAPSDAYARAASVSATADAALPVANFRCEGGIVRETLAGPGHEVCLCPGNTARSQTGERAYACEKRYARGR